VTLKLIGAGFGRMGTRATKDALEMLGLGPCHHMAEVFAHLETVPAWADALDNRPTTAEDWEPLLGGYRSAVDWPGCHYWRELAVAFPDAKVLLSTRDPEAWYASINKNIFEVTRIDTVPEDETGMRQRHHDMILKMIREQTFSGDIDDKDYVLKVLSDHEDEVRDTVDKDRLLVWSVTEGWEPLCAFLGCPVPSEPFPNRNSTKEFRENLDLDPKT
jgi:hypothetical protein